MPPFLLANGGRRLVLAQNRGMGLFIAPGPPTGPGGGGDPGTPTAPVWLHDTPPGGFVGVPYTAGLAASGVPPATYAVTSGAQPAGLNVDPITGVLSGIPTTAATYNFQVTASNGVAPDAVTPTITIVIAASGTMPALIAVNDPGAASPISWATFLASHCVPVRQYSHDNSRPVGTSELQGYKRSHVFTVADTFAGGGVLGAGGGLALVCTRPAAGMTDDGGAHRDYVSGMLQTGGSIPDGIPVLFQCGPGIRSELDYICGFYSGDIFGDPDNVTFPSSSSFAGLFPAPIWWMSKQGGVFGWPPEVDQCEQFGNRIRMAAHMHTSAVFNDSSGTMNGHGYNSGPIDANLGVQTAMEWQAGQIEFFCDGSSIGIDTGPFIPQIPMYALINLAIGSAGGTPNPSDFPTDESAGAVLIITRFTVSSL